MAVVGNTGRQTPYERIESATAKLAYCSLAEQGAATARTLSRRLDEPLLTIYSVLDTLCDRGLVVREQGEASPVYTTRG